MADPNQAHPFEQDEAEMEHPNQEETQINQNVILEAEVEPVPTITQLRRSARIDDRPVKHYSPIKQIKKSAKNYSTLRDLDPTRQVALLAALTD